MFLALIATAAAFAQEAAEAGMSAGTLGDYTGPASGVVAVLLVLDRFGLLRLKRDGSDEAPAPAENAAIAALAERVKAVEDGRTRLESRADDSQTERARHSVRLDGLRRDLDGLRSQTAADRAADRVETSGRLDRLADDIRATRG